MLSLTQGGRFPLLTLVSMRGEYGEGNPWQFAMGQAVEPVLKAMGVIVLRCDAPDDVVPPLLSGAAPTRSCESLAQVELPNTRVQETMNDVLVRFHESNPAAESSNIATVPAVVISEMPQRRAA